MAKDMTTGNTLKMIITFSLPVLLGNVFQQLYNMVDTMIVGQYLGEEALAAVGTTGCLMFLVLGFANGIAQGFGVMISHAFGAKDYKLLKHYVGVALGLTAIVSIILMIPTVWRCYDLLVMMKTPQNIIHLSESYIKVIFAGIILTMSYNVASGILRGVGDSKTPLYFLIVASLLNIVLDIFFIVVVHLGTAGAAFATIISQGVSAILCFVYMFSKYEILRINKSDLLLDFYTVKKMLSVGILMALNYSITAIGTIIFQRAVNVYGSNVVAAYTAASKVCNLATQPIVTLGTAVATFCGQNLGAGKYDRIFKGMREAFLLCIAVSAFAALVCCLGGPIMIGWFIKNPSEEVYSYGMQYLYLASCFMIPLAWIFVYRNALQSMDQGLVPMISGAVELIARYVAIALFANSLGYVGVCLADPFAWFTTGALLLVTYIVWKKKNINYRCSIEQSVV